VAWRYYYKKNIPDDPYAEVEAEERAEEERRLLGDEAAVSPLKKKKNLAMS